MRESAFYAGCWHDVLVCLQCDGSTLRNKRVGQLEQRCTWCAAPSGDLVDLRQACEHGQIQYSAKWRRSICQTCGEVFDEVEW